MSPRLTFAAFGIASTVQVASASAQSPRPYYPPATVEYAEAPPGGGYGLAAPANAFELSLGMGYTQGFGSLQSGVGLPSVATAGIGLDIGLGYRINPRWAILWSGEYQELTAERTTAARGASGTIAGQFHFAPMERVDPWIELGVGYRYLWEDPLVGSRLYTHGFQLARLRAGVDLRAEDAVALGPMIGADATLFSFQDLPGISTNIDEPRLSTFVFAGVQGRFDFGGKVRRGRQVIAPAATASGPARGSVHATRSR